MNDTELPDWFKFFWYFLLQWYKNRLLLPFYQEQVNMLTINFINYKGLFLTFLVQSLYFFVKKKRLCILSVTTFCVLYIQYV